MKKELLIAATVAFFGILSPVYSAENTVLKTEKKDVILIDDSKMQEVKNDEKIDKKAAKKAEKREKKLEEERIRQKKEELKQAEKENKKVSKQNAEADKAENVKNADNETKANAENKAQAQNKSAKVEEKSVNADNEKEESARPVKLKERKVRAEESDENIKEVSDTKEVKNEEEITQDKAKAEENAAADKEKSKDEKEEITKDEPEQKEAVEDEKEEKAENKEDVPQSPELYRKNLTFEDIDKKAVSINEFLGFSEKQNEKFSLFYHKTTSQMNVYNMQIKNRQDLVREIKKGNMSAKGQYEKLKKAEHDLEFLMRERDTYYNKALQKFNSLLNKKQAMKWELLQQMGYRFLPELE